VTLPPNFTAFVIRKLHLGKPSNEKNGNSLFFTKLGGVPQNQKLPVFSWRFFLVLSDLYVLKNEKKKKNSLQL